MVFIDDEKKRAMLVKSTSPRSLFHIAIQRPSILPFWKTCYHIEVLRDPSHGRNYRISEWFSLLAEAGFTASLVRSWTIPLDLASWTQRIQTPPASVEQIERLFADASSLTRERLHIGLKEEGLLSFALPAAVIVGVKPV